MSEAEKLSKKIKLPSIPKEHDVRFRNKFDRVRAFMCWHLQLDEFAKTHDHPLQAKSMLYTLDNEKNQFLKALYKILKKNMTFLKHFEAQEKNHVVDVFPVYLHALEWAVDYDVETSTMEVKLRKAYVDSITEQCFGGKYVKSKVTGKREWQIATRVPHRITDVHKFAAFIVPTTSNIGFNSTRDALTQAGIKNTDRREKNKFRAIQIQMSDLSQQW